MKTLLTVTVALLSLTVAAQPQKTSVVIGSKISRPNALLIVNPQNSDQGVLLPQLSTGQRISMKPSSPSENGLIVFDTSQKSYFFWSDGKWVKLRDENSPITKFHSIDPVSFRELKPDYNFAQSSLVMFESENTFVTASGNGYGETIIAPIDVPHGAVIEEITLYYLDNDDDNLQMYLTRKSFTGNTEQMVGWTSSGASASIRNQSFNAFNVPERIDLENYRLGKENFHFQVFNRWGDLVFESLSREEMATHGWNGRSLNGRELAGGTYPYRLTGLDKTGTRLEKKGVITIIY